MSEAGARPPAPAVEPPPDGAAWTVLHLVRWSAGWLEGRGVRNARLEVEHLLADTLGTDRLQLYLDFERPLGAEELAAFRPRLRERARRRPLQYILGRTDFRELTLRTDPRALIPRPETEELVDRLLTWARRTGREGLRALDIGTGTGAIALSLLREGPFERVVATDLSTEALDLAAENAHLHGLSERVEFRAGDRWAPLASGERFDLVVSNPPYVSEADWAGLEPEVREWEPRAALVAGDEGRGVALDLIAGAPAHLEAGGLLAMEIGSGQGARLAEAIRAAGAYEEDVRVERDLARRERFVFATRRGRSSGAGVDAA